MTEIRLRYTGPVGMPTGYGQAAHDTLLAILAAGIDIEIDPVLPPDPKVLEERYNKLLEYPKRYTDSWPTHYLVHTAPKFAHHMANDDLAPPEHIPRLLYTTWETSQVGNEAITAIDDAFDYVVVPSTYNRDVFVRSGIAPNKLRVIAHAIDPTWWAVPQTPPVPTARAFTFYSILTWCERKNPIGLLKAYFHAFLGITDVRLIVVSTLGISREDVEALKLAMRVPPDTLPKVEFIVGPTRLTDHAVRQLHQDSDCYVTVGRGEGFGLPLLEAALVGNPVIAPRWSGYQDFLDTYPDTMYINTQMTPAFPGPGSLDSGAITPDQLWAEPDLEGAIRTMRAVYTRRASKRPSSDLAERFSYQAIGAEWRHLLESI